jgi:hypothetical protein
MRLLSVAGSHVTDYPFCKFTLASALLPGFYFWAFALKERAYWAYRKGYAFHQREVRRDPKLLEWVLRKDYWDYALPDGWQNYLK